MKKPFAFLPNIMWKDGRITANSLDVKKSRNASPKGPESFFVTDMMFNSKNTLWTTIASYGAGSVLLMKDSKCAAGFLRSMTYPRMQRENRVKGMKVRST
jgi:hypothetical protein